MAGEPTVLVVSDEVRQQIEGQTLIGEEGFYGELRIAQRRRPLPSFSFPYPTQPTKFVTARLNGEQGTAHVPLVAGDPVVLATTCTTCLGTGEVHHADWTHHRVSYPDQCPTCSSVGVVPFTEPAAYVNAERGELPKAWPLMDALFNSVERAKAVRAGRPEPEPVTTDPGWLVTVADLRVRSTP